MPAKNRVYTARGTRYDIEYVVVRNRKVPYVFIGQQAFSLEGAIEQAETAAARLYR